MTEPRTTTIKFGGCECRVWEKGEGPTLGFLAGFFGLPRWLPVLDELAKTHRVIAPSLPGFPGGLGHTTLHDTVDYVINTLELLELSGLKGADLIGASVGGMLACEAAAMDRAMVKRLALIAPMGLYDGDLPTADPFAVTETAMPALLAKNAGIVAGMLMPPPGADQMDYMLQVYRSLEAAARLLWPMGDRGLLRRLPRITQKTLILWGADDKVLSPKYADKFADGISGDVTSKLVKDAGHLAYLDKPADVAKEIAAFLK